MPDGLSDADWEETPPEEGGCPNCGAPPKYRRTDTRECIECGEVVL